jgi:hypothetical protein
MSYSDVKYSGGRHSVGAGEEYWHPRNFCLYCAEQERTWQRKHADSFTVHLSSDPVGCAPRAARRVG